MKKIIFILCLVGFLPATALAEGGPDCTGKDSWPAAMSGVKLKNAGLIKKIDFKTIEVRRLASEKINPDIYQQIHEIRLVTPEGEKFTVITINKASKQECSESDVEVFLGSYLDKK